MIFLDLPGYPAAYPTAPSAIHLAGSRNRRLAVEEAELRDLQLSIIGYMSGLHTYIWIIFKVKIGKYMPYMDPLDYPAKIKDISSQK